jgi:ribonuclease-3 family protein
MHEKIIAANLPTPLALAYLGDARHSLYVRAMLVKRGLAKPGDLNREALKFVTAESQARMYERVEPILLDDERDMFRRASNSTHLNKPKSASGKDYRTATGFEAIVGMLEWIGDTDRLNLILDTAHERIEK